MSRNTVVAEPFVNEFGQTINPGDDVIYAGTSWKSTRFGKGKFVGVYKRPGTRRWNRQTYSYEYSGEPVVSAVRVDGIPGTRWKSHGYDENGKYLGGVSVDVTRSAILPLKRVFRLDTSLEAFDGHRF